MRAVQYIHSTNIVHRDLKPENLLFRTKEEEADIMIADFGLSRVMDEDKLTQLTEVCGTPGYMAPEIFKRSAYHPPSQSPHCAPDQRLQPATGNLSTSGLWV
jgi:calcium/calmodulin-dependent protein kinase I